MAAWGYEQNFEALSTGALTGQDSWTKPTGNDLTVINSLAYTGSQCVQGDASGGNASAARAITAVTDDDSTVYISIRYTGGGTQSGYVRLLDSGGNIVCAIQISIGSSITLRGTSNTDIATIVSSPSADTWYRIGLKLHFTNDTVAWNLNNGTFSTPISWGANKSSVESIRLQANGTGSNKFYWDDISASYSALTTRSKTIQAKARIKRAGMSSTIQAKACIVPVRHKQVDTFLADGTWTAPSGVTTASVECWGSGGGGSQNVGGGGGGAYSKGQVSVTPSSGYGVVVGESAANTNGEDSTFNTTSVVAKGGLSGGNGGTGGQSSAGTGDTKYSGGAGSLGTGSRGGGGGAGDSASGGDGGSATRGVGGERQGGRGGLSSGEGGYVAGGGGSFTSSQSAGHRGEVRVAYQKEITDGSPYVGDRTYGRFDFAVSHVIDLPCGAIGDLVVVVAYTASNSSLSPSAGWTELTEVTNANLPGPTAAVYYKRLTGNDTLTVTPGDTAELTYEAWLIRDAYGDPTAQSVAPDFTDTVDWAGVSTTGDKNLVIVCAGYVSGGTPSAAPSGYGSLIIQSGKSANRVNLFSAEKFVDGPGVETPGDVTLSGFKYFVGFTINIRGASRSSSVRAKARIKKAGVSSTIQAKARILVPGASSTAQARARIFKPGNAITITAGGRIFKPGNAITIQAKARISGARVVTIRSRARIFKPGNAVTITAGGRIFKPGNAVTIQAKARIVYTRAVTIQARARIKRAAVTATLQAKSRVKRLGTSSTVQAKAKILQTVSYISARARIKHVAIPVTITAGGRIFKPGNAVTIQARARIFKNNIAYTAQARARIFKPGNAVTIQAKARIKRTGIAVTIRAKARIVPRPAGFVRMKSIDQTRPRTMLQQDIHKMPSKDQSKIKSMDDIRIV